MQIPNPDQKAHRFYRLFAAFASWWGVLNAIAASLTALNLIRNFFSIELTAVLSTALSIYQGLVHEPIKWLARLIPGFDLPGWVIDLTIFWLLLGGIVLRSASVLRKSGLQADFGSAHRDVWGYLFLERGSTLFFVTVCLILWPAVVYTLLREPLVHTVDSEIEGEPTGLVASRGDIPALSSGSPRVTK